MMRSKRANKKFIRTGYREEEREQVTLLKEEMHRLIEKTQRTQFKKFGNDFAKNENKFLFIQSLLVNDVFVTICAKKAQLLNTHFVQQWSLIDTGGTLSLFRPLTH